MRRLYFCSKDGSRVVRTETFPDDYAVPTNMGGKRADALQGSSKATLVAPGATGATGNVTYTARHGGSSGNNIFIEHTPGETGAEHPDRPLEVIVDLEDVDGISVMVVFGTTSSGFTIVPTAEQVANAINTKAELRDVVAAASGGTGDVGVVDPTYLGGGSDNGDWRKFNVYGGDCLRINTVEVV